MGLRVDERRVRVLMAERGIRTQLQLARLAGLHRVTVIELLQGHNFNSDSVDKMAAALGVSPLDVLTTEGVPAPLLAAPALAAESG